MVLRIGPQCEIMFAFRPWLFRFWRPYTWKKPKPYNVHKYHVKIYIAYRLEHNINRIDYGLQILFIKWKLIIFSVIFSFYINSYLSIKMCFSNVNHETMFYTLLIGFFFLAYTKWSAFNNSLYTYGIILNILFIFE